MGEEANGRVTTREFYDAQLLTIQLIHTVKDELMEEIKPLVAIATQVDTNKDEIKTLRDRSNWLDGINAVIALAAATIAGLLGSNDRMYP